MKNPVSISLIVPVYEEEYNVVPNIRDLIFKLENTLAVGVIRDYELLIFQSTIRTLDFLKHRDLVSNERIRLINHCGNTKIGSIFAKGIRLAQKEYIGLIPPYNQISFDSLGDIFSVLDCYDMAVAFIGNHEARPWYRKVASIANVILINLLFNLDLKYYHLNFYQTKLVKKIRIKSDSHAAMVEIAVWLAKSGAKITQVPFTMIPHNFKSKSLAFDFNNIWCILKTYAWLFWRVMILRERIDLN